MKHTKEEKIKIKEAKFEAKYGDPTLKALVEKAGPLDIAAELYYDMYKQANRDVCRGRIRAVVLYSISLALVFAGLWFPGFMISGAVFLVVATHEALNSRIDLLHSFRARDQLHSLVKDYLAAKRVIESMEGKDTLEQLKDFMKSDKKKAILNKEKE